MTGTGCISTYSHTINGQTYSVISGDELCWGDVFRGANNFSVNFSNGSAPGCDWVSTGIRGETKRFRGYEAAGPSIYNETSGTNLIYNSFFVTGQSLSEPNLSGPTSPMWINGVVVCNGEIYQSPGEAGYFKVIRADWVNSNGDAACPSCDIGAYHPGPPYEIGVTGDGWKVVKAPECYISNNFTQFKSITGSGIIGATEQLIDGAPYITITGSPCILTGCDYNPIEIDLCSGGVNITIEVLGRRVS